MTLKMRKGEGAIDVSYSVVVCSKGCSVFIGNCLLKKSLESPGKGAKEDMEPSCSCGNTCVLKTELAHFDRLLPRFCRGVSAFSCNFLRLRFFGTVFPFFED